MNHFSVITITHKTANINHIGQYIPSYNDSHSLATTLHHVKAEMDIAELMYLATCNRVTFFMVQNSTTQIDRPYLLRFFAHLHPNIPAHCLHDMANLVTVYNGSDAVKHIFEVAASIDSLVVGEREILRQLKEAYTFCSERHLTGDSIRLAMKTAIPLAKDIYTQTKIGENSVSVVSLAMQKMLALAPPKDARIVIVGAGQTNTLVSKFLLKYGFTNYTIFNRTLKNAQHLANKLNGAAHTLEDLAHYTGNFDILISCTGAKEPVITHAIYQQLLAADTNPKIVIDLAVPNDVAATVKNSFPIHYIEVEELRELAQENLRLRKEEIVKARHLIANKLEEFKLLIRQRRIERAMAALPEQIKDLKDKAFNTVFQKEIAQLDENSRAILQKVVGYLEQKYIGIPIKIAKNAIAEELATKEAL
ncbi:MAG TPA: glutamyl-tRNA reductase [Chitinophagales bacterium]|nr:glutamyl-tRNA reductase [Chitinophagales bacterium]